MVEAIQRRAVATTSYATNFYLAALPCLPRHPVEATNCRCANRHPLALPRMMARHPFGGVGPTTLKAKMIALELNSFAYWSLDLGWICVIEIPLGV